MYKHKKAYADYPYLKKQARERLAAARIVARNTGLAEKPVVRLGGFSYCFFPWLGTRSFRALRRMIKNISGELRISGLEYEGCYFITFKMAAGNDYELIRALAKAAQDPALRGISLVSGNEAPVFEKYDDYVPPELLRHAYATDKLNLQEAVQRILEIEQEF